MAVTCLAGCSVTEERSEALDALIDEELAAASSAPPSVEDTLPLLTPPSEPSFEPPPEERFHLTVENAPAADVLMSLVADTDMNMVVHPEVNATITLDLRHVTVEEVLAILRDFHDLEYQRTPTGYMVRPARLENRLYEISYLDIQREGASRTRISSGQSTENPAAMQDNFGSGLGGGTTGGSLAGSDEEASGTKIETTSESDFWEGLEGAIRGVLEEQTGRNVMINPMSGIVSVRAMPAEHRAVAELIDAIQGSIQRQVILEAKIIEVELRDGFRSGINWTALADVDGRLLSFSQAAGPGIFDEGLSSIAGRPMAVSPGEIFQGFEGSAFGGAGIAAIDTGDFNGFIELLETQGVARVLSSPRVATVNNQKAVIKVGTDEFFVTNVTGRTATGGASTTAASSVQLTPFFSGIALDVTPQISRSGDVILHIHPMVSEVTDQTKNFTVAGNEESLPLAFSSVRESDSIIRARNGQVVVIGGLMRESTVQDRFGTPILSRVPLIGHAFSSRQERSIKTELVILLRPIVVSDESAWQEQASSARDRLRKFNTGGR
jgi:MSHA biogenesis protein MshL